MISAYAARWSLSSNAGLQLKVMEIAPACAAVEPEPVAASCAIITAAESRDQSACAEKARRRPRLKARHEEKKG
jgi:hypothetical protein